MLSVQVLGSVKVLCDVNIIAMDELWTLWCVFEGLANGIKDHGEGDLWMLETTLCGFPLMCISFIFVSRLLLCVNPILFH